MITVRYRVRYDECSVTPAEFALVQYLFNQGFKARAIQFMRQQYNVGLVDAKLICEGIAEMPETGATLAMHRADEAKVETETGTCTLAEILGSRFQELDATERWDG